MFNVQEGVHQGSVRSPLLFIIVFVALSREFQTGFPWELLYADDLVIIADTKMNYSANCIYEKKNIWKPKALEQTWERPKL